MRTLAILMTATALAACGGGGGVQTVGSAAIATSPTPTTSTPTPTTTGGGVSSGTGATTSTPTPTTGTGGGVSAGTTATVPAAGFLTVSTAKTFEAVGGLSSLKVATTGGILYQGNASTVRTPSGTIAYDPRDGIFTLTVADTKAGVNDTVRYQDPGHRTTSSAQLATPNLAGFNYLTSIGTSVTDDQTFFYQRPGYTDPVTGKSTTTYVTLAGFVRNNTPAAPADQLYERGAFVFGDKTLVSNTPNTGTGTFQGGFIATMIVNPAIGSAQSYNQWMFGGSTVNVDFARGTVGVALSGTVDNAFLGGAPVLAVAVPAGSTFTANGSGTIDLVRTGGFTGSFASAAFGIAGTSVTVALAPISAGSNTAGASSFDGAFYGPGAVELGGDFRITGGIPNQRVDILGAFTAAKVAP